MLTLPFLFYLFLVRYSSFPLISGLPDSFPSCFQSPTTCNRLSINIPAGSLLGSLLGVALKHFITKLLSSCSSSGNIIIVFLLSLFLCVIFPLEVLNSSVQLFTSSLSQLAYSAAFSVVIIIYSCLALRKVLFPFC